MERLYGWNRIGGLVPGRLLAGVADCLFHCHCTPGGPGRREFIFPQRGTHHWHRPVEVALLMLIQRKNASRRFADAFYDLNSADTPFYYL